jgi:hypothetical protein
VRGLLFFFFTGQPLTSFDRGEWKVVRPQRMGPSPSVPSLERKTLLQGCQMVCFQTKNPNFGKFCRVLQWKILVYFMTIWSILRPFGIFYGHLVYFAVIWYIFPVFVFCTKKNLATLLYCAAFYVVFFTWVWTEP